MNIPLRHWVLFAALTVGLIAGMAVIPRYLQERTLHALPYGFRTFNVDSPAPVCGRWRDHMPSTRDPEPYHLYIKARKVWRSKLEGQLTRAETTRILTDVSKAAELGDWGARALLAHFYLYGLGIFESNRVLASTPEKSVEIVRDAAIAGQPWGVYDLVVAYENGYGGVVRDNNLAWSYFLRAAELGSPDAQMTLAEAYRDAGHLSDEEIMLNCAYQQGHGPAAYELGIKAELRNRYMEAIKLYQDGVTFGSKECAASLELIFKDGHGPGVTEEQKVELKRHGIQADPERKRRYSAIYDLLAINPDLRLKRLDSVLPLPPAALPNGSDVTDAITPESDELPSY